MTNPLRVAVVGSGPTGFYAAEDLLKQTDPEIAVDMFDRLPSPYGLVRYGVAPDHQKIKSVIAVYDKVADNPRFRFFGNVEVGSILTLDELRANYAAVIFCTGAQTDRRLGIPGEDLPGSHPATEFVAWYNGHPDFRDHKFDLSVENVAVVGVGNVAVDVARILCRTPAELEQTDIADYALEALRHSQVKNVYMLGRRGVAQAAFSNPEVRELTQMEGADLVLNPEELVADPQGDKAIAKRIEILQTAAKTPLRGLPRQLHLRFLVSPVELVGEGQVHRLRLVHNRLDENSQAIATDEKEELEVGMVFRSVGYRGVPLAGLPFDEKRGIISSDAGRVQPGLYVAGWIKRGPSGVIGTNKPCAKETVESLLADLKAGKLQAGGGGVAELLSERKHRTISFADWKHLDKLEVERGAGKRPRVKFTSTQEMLDALGAEVR